MGLLVLTLRTDGISAITRFDHTALEAFELPRTTRPEVKGPVPGTCAVNEYAAIWAFQCFPLPALPFVMTRARGDGGIEVLGT